MIEQVIITIIILFTLAFFIWGKWRYDIVALVALFLTAFLGLIPLDEIFDGFTHPVVILVVAMIIISKGLISSGAIDIVSRYLKFAGLSPTFQLGLLCLFTTAVSAFINSMGALAFVVPIAIKMARQSNTPISLFLMPIAFASHFGGGITVIGSVSNVIISGFRAEEIAPFGFFDFAFVAFPVAIANILFVTLIGWRFMPRKKDFVSKEKLLKNYITELKVSENSPIIGKNIEEFYKFSKEYFFISNIVRGEENIIQPSNYIVIKEGDILVMEADTATIESIIVTSKLELLSKEYFQEESSEMAEVIVSKYSSLIGQNSKELDIYNNYKVRLVAINRTRAKKEERIGDIRFMQGDILIIKGEKEKIKRFIGIFNMLSLKEREFNFEGEKKKALIVSSIFLFSIFLSVVDFLPIEIIFITSALIIISLGIIPVKEIYKSVDFSMIVMIAVMMHLGLVFYETGAALFFAEALMLIPEMMTPEIALAVIFILSIWLSDILSNVAVSVLLAPVAFSISYQLGVSFDPFLMAVAIGSGSSYLTPIGHQSNIFVMNLGNYKFTDYWKLGLPLEIITFSIGLPLLLYFWPF